jgi:hypothetical protein
MKRDQQTAPLPPDPPGREDIVSDEQREENLIPGKGESAPLPRDPAGPEDVLRTESQDGPVAGG